MAHRLSTGVRLFLVVAILLSTSFTSYNQPLIAATPTPAPLAIGTPVPTQSYSQAKKQLDEIFRQVATLRRLLDRTQFDLAELNNSLAGDAQEIVDFMRAQIAFEQYPGMLRGAQGTLMSRAGNALDQSLLLNHLLLDAGYEAKIQHGTLQTADAERLLQQMFVKRNPSPPISKEMDKIEATLQNMLSSGGLSNDQVAGLIAEIVEPTPIDESVPYSVTLDDADYLQDLLADANVTLGNSDAESKLVEEAKDYFWVDYRLGPSEKWQSVHPAFGEAEPPSKLTASESFADESEIPESLQQRFQMQISIEHKVGDLIETVPLFAPLSGVAADMIGRPHSFAIVPDGYTDSEDFQDPISALKKSNMFFPALDGKLVRGANFFDLLGNLIPPDAAQSPLAGLITGVSKSLSGALDALDSAGNASDEKKDDGYYLLTGVYVDYTFNVPGQEPKVFRRTLMDRIGAQNRAQGVWKLRNGNNNLPDLIELTSKYTLMLAPSSMPQSYTADVQLKHLYDLKPFFDFALGNQYQRPGFQLLSNAKLDKYDFTWPGHAVIYSLFDSGAATISSINYRPTPSLVLYKEQQNGESKQAWTDVVNNQRRAYRLEKGTIVDDSAALLTTGVWETRTEGALLGEEAVSNDTSGEVENVFTLFDAANQQSIAHKVLTSADIDSLDKLKIPADALPQLQADLQAGNVVILPEAMPKGVTQFGWWRIDPTSGQTLGVNQDGMGAASVEYVVLLRSVAFAAGCAFIAGHDTNGLTVQDAIVCASVGVGAYGTLATLGVTGKLVVAVAAMIGTGAWLNNSPGLQRPIIRP